MSFIELLCIPNMFSFVAFNSWAWAYVYMVITKCIRNELTSKLYTWNIVKKRESAFLETQEHRLFVDKVHKQPLNLRVLDFNSYKTWWLVEENCTFLIFLTQTKSVCASLSVSLSLTQLKSTHSTQLSLRLLCIVDAYFLLLYTTVMFYFHTSL